jgi:hypothetical protein
MKHTFNLKLFSENNKSASDTSFITLDHDNWGRRNWLILFGYNVQVLANCLKATVHTGN